MGKANPGPLSTTHKRVRALLQVSTLTDEVMENPAGILCTKRWLQHFRPYRFRPTSRADRIHSVWLADGYYERRPRHRFYITCWSSTSGSEHPRHLSYLFRHFRKTEWMSTHEKSTFGAIENTLRPRTRTRLYPIGTTKSQHRT